MNLSPTFHEIQVTVHPWVPDEIISMIALKTPDSTVRSPRQACNLPREEHANSVHRVASPAEPRPHRASTRNENIWASPDLAGAGGVSGEPLIAEDPVHEQPL